MRKDSDYDYMDCFSHEVHLVKTWIERTNAIDIFEKR